MPASLLFVSGSAAPSLPVTAAMISCCSKVAPFSCHVFGEQCNMEVDLGAFLFLMKKTLFIHPLPHNWPNEFGAVNTQYPPRHIAQRSAARWPLWDRYQHFLWDVFIRWLLSIIPGVFNMCVFCKGSLVFLFPGFPFTPPPGPWDPRHPGERLCGAGGWVCCTWGTRCGSPAT